MSAAAGEPGSVAEEAARLLEALSEWARTNMGAASGLGGLAGAATAGMGESSECRLCPLCQLIGVLRSARPETFEHLLDAGEALMAALRSAVEAHEREWASRRRGGVERIDIG